jgi:uncharacterized protein YfaP (DUF2135 family)
MRTRTLLVASAAVALTLGCGLGGHSSSNGGGGAPPPPAATNGAPATTRAKATGAPATTKAKATGAPAQPARLGGCAKVPNGNTCHIQGTGFGYDEQVTVTVEGEGLPQKVVQADDQGAFTWDYAIRSGPGTVVTVRAEGATSGRHARFSYTLT